MNVCHCILAVTNPKACAICNNNNEFFITEITYDDYSRYDKYIREIDVTEVSL